MRRKARAAAMPAALACFRADDWIGGPLTDEELRTYGRQCGMYPHLPSLGEAPLEPGELAGLALSRWLWARWEWADQAGLPGAIEYFVQWLQGPPLTHG